MKAWTFAGICALVTMVGCGGGGGDMEVGSWRYVGPGSADQSGDVTDTLELGASGTYSSTTVFSYSATAMEARGCSATASETGAYSVSGTTMTFTPSANGIREVRTNCMDPQDDNPGQTYMLPAYTRTFSATASTLTLNASTGARNYTRQ